MSGPPAPYAWRPVGVVALGLFALLMAVAGRYGYHRDELYFLAAGRHLDWGDVDQPPLTPCSPEGCPRWWGTRSRRPDPSGPDGGGDRARRGVDQPRARGRPRRTTADGRRDRDLGHGADQRPLVSTTTVDLLIWAVLCWLVIRAVRSGGGRCWLWAGWWREPACRTRPWFCSSWPRWWPDCSWPVRARSSADPWLWGAGALALVIWAPNLMWQAPPWAALLAPSPAAPPQWCSSSAVLVCPGPPTLALTSAA